MLKFTIQEELLINNWKPEVGKNEMEWSKRSNGHEYYARILGPSIVYGYFLEAAEIYFKDGSPMLKTGIYMYAYDINQIPDIILKIQEATIQHFTI